MVHIVSLLLLQRLNPVPNPVQRMDEEHVWMVSIVLSLTKQVVWWGRESQYAYVFINLRQLLILAQSVYFTIKTAVLQTARFLWMHTNDIIHVSLLIQSWKEMMFSWHLGFFFFGIDFSYLPESLVLHTVSYYYSWSIKKTGQFYQSK